MYQGIHPQGGPRPTSSSAERRIHGALNGRGRLPDGATVWHSFAFNHEGHDYEIDFLYAHPQRGIIAIEAKGGQITLNDGLHFQNGKPIPSPIGQARAAVHQLAAYLDAKLGYRPPFSHAVWFPDMSEPIAPRAAEYDGRALGMSALTYPREALEALSEQVFADLRPPKNDEFIRRLHELWGASSHERPIPLGLRFANELSRRAFLDEKQREILDSLIENERCIIRGAAGTGKSQLARLAAKEMAQSGKNVLLTCFTEGLAQVLGRACSEPNIRVATVRALAQQYAREAGKVDREPTTGEEWERQTTLGAEALLDQGSPWDVIVIDEAQDFGDNDWLFIMAAGGEDKPLWLFLDEAQRFWEEREIPADILKRAARYKLQEQYRVPRALMSFAEAILHTKGSRRPTPAGGEDLTDEEETIQRTREIAELEGELEIICRQDPLRALEAALEHAINKQSVRPEHIAILSLRGAGPRNSIASAERIGTFDVARVSSDDAHEKIVADTFLRFKGLERPLIFIMDLERSRPGIEKRLHIALTRALNRAVIITTPEAAKAHGLE